MRSRVLATVAELTARALESPLMVRDVLAPLDLIVVLGAPLRADGGLSAVALERVVAAAELFALGGAPRVCVTGGVTRGAARPEAAAMAEVLVELGVPSGVVVVEDRATSTADNAARVAALVPDARAVWLVSQPFHGRRARRLFDRTGFDTQV